MRGLWRKGLRSGIDRQAVESFWCGISDESEFSKEQGDEIRAGGG